MDNPLCSPELAANLTGRHYFMKTHHKKVKIEIQSAVELIRTKGKLLGDGAEGDVYKITKGVVAKIWYANFFGKTTSKALVARFKNIEKYLKKYPKWVKQPEFLGIEEEGEQIITYHEYIPRSRRKEYTNKFFLEVNKGDLCDTNLENMIENEKGLYLIDAAVCRYKS